MKLRCDGTIWRLGDHIDTDVLFPARYMTLAAGDAEGLRHVLDAESELGLRIRPGDVIVAGRNFGCGSSREYAPQALQTLGVSCVVAESFGHIFYRNCANIGLPLLEVPDTAALPDAGPIVIDFATGRGSFPDAGVAFEGAPVAERILELFAVGGLLNLLAQRSAGG